MFTIKENRRLTTEVAVVGGGTAGVFAAISAARAGAKTLLIEKNSMLGGTLTTAAVNFPGLFFAWGKQIINGPCWEAIQRTIALGGGTMPRIQYKPERHWQEQIRLNRFVYCYVITEMCREAGVTVLTNAMISAAEETEDGMHLLVTEKGGLLQVDTKIAIDTTGDGNLVMMMGFPCEKSPVQQPATLHNHISGYDPEAIRQEDVDSAVRCWNDAHPDTPMDAGQLLHFLREGWVNNHTVCLNAETSIGKTAVEASALRNLMDYYQVMRTIPGGENLQVDFIAEETGIRESVRIIGEATVTAEDYLKGICYPDAVCYAFYPIDLHVASGIEQTFLAEGVVPTIPYGALVPKGARRLLCAGRCASSDTYANSAIRVQAPCMAMGQAAGCAAALAARSGSPVYPPELPKLRSALRAIGGIVPK